ncbi:hypothetical protein ACQE32_15240 [Pantoea sp. FN0302]|uniref:hypothetical protein n=1 Tax=Pantoea sp. FN0302 TaxID=3418558 RepID=UPI003CF3E5C6
MRFFTSVYSEHGKGGALKLLPSENGCSVIFDKIMKKFNLLSEIDKATAYIENVMNNEKKEV